MTAMTTESSELIDLHCHLLPDLDDGPADLMEAIGLATSMAEQGVDTVVCTPHFNRRITRDTKTALAYLDRRDHRLAELQQAVRAHNLDLQLVPGLEIELTSGILELIDRLGPQRFCLGSSNLILIEVTRVYPETLSQLNTQLYELQALGLQPVLAHVERSLSGLDHAFDTLADWAEQGRVLLQVNADSVLELDRRIDLPFMSGYQRRKFLRDLLAQDLVSFVASDAHSLDLRPSRLSGAFRLIWSRWGLETARRLCGQNQLQVLNP